MLPVVVWLRLLLDDCPFAELAARPFGPELTEYGSVAEPVTGALEFVVEFETLFGLLPVLVEESC
ncbi:MAG: hypothetical protein ACXVZX_06540 [Terriglobales bacterium]